MIGPVVTTYQGFVSIAARELEPNLDYVSSIEMSADDALALAGQLIASAAVIKAQEAGS
ncbi:hypothetical protein [Pseudoclavibacter sp. JSM 162008]|uniref:hypothetical protein n=1 Tax=Pseudoclavibacter sp. JSM 162008 TaxID=3229855 RepID=UPI003524DAA0